MVQTNNVYFMSAVGFKPPHKGHLHMIKEAVNKASTRGANYKLFIGRSPRGDITLDQSLKMLNLFLNDAGVSLGDGIGEVEINAVAESNPTSKVYGDNPRNRKQGRVGKRVYTSSPLQPLINLAVEMPEGSKIVVPSSSEDSERAETLKNILSHSRPDIKVEKMIVEPVSALEGEGKLSATGMREAIKSGEFEKFKEYIPESSLDKAEGIWTNILGRELPVNNVDTNELDEMIRECLKDTVKNILKEGWVDDDLDYQMDQGDAREGENLSSDKEAAKLANIAASHPIVSNFNARTYDMFEKQIGHEIKVNGLSGQEAIDTALRIVRNLTTVTDDLEEASSMAGGAVQGGGGQTAKRDEQDALIREVYDYLVKTGIFKD